MNMETMRLETQHYRRGYRTEQLRKWIRPGFSPGVPETLVTLLLLAGFVSSTWFSWQIDRLAAPIDAGMLSVLLLAVLLILVFKQVAAWLCAGWLVFTLNSLTEWQKVIFYGCLYLSFFWGLVLVFIAML